MKLVEQNYVPCLRWKMGEYQAIYRLSSKTKEMIVPIIEVPEIGFDFETRRENKSIDEHLKFLPKRVNDKWGKGDCFVDLRLIDPSSRMADGSHPMDYIFSGLREHGISATPVVGPEPDSSFLAAIKKVISVDEFGLCIRVGIDKVRKSAFASSISPLLSECGVSLDNSDLVIDLGAPNFYPIDMFSRIIVNIYEKLPNLNRWRSITLLGTSFPSTMGEVSLGSSILPRSEWQLYKQIVPAIHNAGLRIPSFGDYSINHPDVVHIDMRIVKPMASLRYSIDDSWFIVKGLNVRDHKFEQYRELCKTVVNNKNYYGRQFSKGDDYIYECAQGSGSTGNLSTWRWVGTNHHIELVAGEVASLFGARNIL